MVVKTICVVGLGYVGLPLAVALRNNFQVIGFDVDGQRITSLQEGKDNSGELASNLLLHPNLTYTADPSRIQEAQFVIICVPTPIDEHNYPDTTYLESASTIVGKNLAPGSIVVYESTVYPGLTEEVCVPLLEQYSGLRCGDGFKAGYSPERINPGDKEHTINKVVKIVSGSDSEALEIIDTVYSTVTKTHRAPSIKVAEAAKVIENIQRDLNIALMNELTLIFDKLGINVYDVLEAAGTKWNFHPYHPGLVGGHCIGVDPYYLTFKAKQAGYDSKVILAGREINDGMHHFYAQKIVKLLSEIKPTFGAASQNSPLAAPSVLILGLTFKPNVPDYRNSRIKYLIEELRANNIGVYAYDPFVDKNVVEREFNAIWKDPAGDLSSIPLVIVAVEHDTIQELVAKGIFVGKKVLSLPQLIMGKGE